MMRIVCVGYAWAAALRAATGARLAPATKVRRVSMSPPSSRREMPTPRTNEQHLFCKLVGENPELVDLRRFGEQIAGFDLFHQRGRHLAVEVRVATSLVVERVEDGERGRSLLNGEPGDRARLGVDQGYGGTQEIRDLLLLARLRLQRNV